MPGRDAGRLRCSLSGSDAEYAQVTGRVRRVDRYLDEVIANVAGKLSPTDLGVGAAAVRGVS